MITNPLWISHTKKLICWVGFELGIRTHASNKTFVKETHYFQQHHHFSYFFDASLLASKVVSIVSFLFINYPNLVCVILKLKINKASSVVYPEVLSVIIPSQISTKALLLLKHDHTLSLVTSPSLRYVITFFQNNKPTYTLGEY
jgi:hypothetical protein